MWSLAVTFKCCNYSFTWIEGQISLEIKVTVRAGLYIPFFLLICPESTRVLGILASLWKMAEFCPALCSSEEERVVCGTTLPVLYISSRTIAAPFQC